MFSSLYYYDDNVQMSGHLVMENDKKTITTTLTLAYWVHTMGQAKSI